VSRTFEGRDRFAPAAAWLAKGIELSALGRPIHDYKKLDVPEPATDSGGLQGAVLRIDRFGNLVTNIDRKAFEKVSAGGALHLTIGGHPIARVIGTYADAAPGELCALFGSTDHLEIALNGASAAEHLGAARGLDVRVARSQ
jgi:hypothetical protein